MNKQSRLLDGPIPGENFTSDTKNYPWHRPPEITDFDKAIEAAMKQLSERTSAYNLLNTISIGIPLSTLATMFVTSGIGAGKWTPDFAILLAGPVCRIMELMAKDAKVDYTLGLDDEPLPTSAFFSTQKEQVTEASVAKAIKDKEKVTDQVKEEMATQRRGFMNRTNT